MNQKFYICKHCGNVIEKVEDKIEVDKYITESFPHIQKELITK